MSEAASMSDNEQAEEGVGIFDLPSEQRWASALFEFMCDYGMIDVDCDGLDLDRTIKILRDNYDCDEALNDPLVKAAEEVCWFDWSSNDSDAAAAIARLRAALAGKAHQP